MSAGINAPYVLPDIASWNHIQTLTYAADNSKTTTGTIKVYDEYMIIWDLVAAANANILIRLNGLSTNIYNYQQIAGAAVSTIAAANAILTARGNTENNCIGMCVMTGISKAVANGMINMYIQSGGQITDSFAIAGSVDLGNATQITSITLLGSASTYTGTAKVYGRNKT